MADKPDWDTYFLAQAKHVSSRSIDTSTKHGCVLVDINHRILSCGYNGPISGLNDDLVPMTRPEKYYWMVHAEENAMAFCHGDLLNGTAYITGFPCSRCARELIQRGIKRIVHGPVVAKMVDEMHIRATEEMSQYKNIELVKGDWKAVCNLLADTYTSATKDVAKESD